MSSDAPEYPTLPTVNVHCIYLPASPGDKQAPLPSWWPEVDSSGRCYQNHVLYELCGCIVLQPRVHGVNCAHNLNGDTYRRYTHHTEHTYEIIRSRMCDACNTVETIGMTRPPPLYSPEQIAVDLAHFNDRIWIQSVPQLKRRDRVRIAFEAHIRFIKELGQDAQYPKETQSVREGDLVFYLRVVTW